MAGYKSITNTVVVTQHKTASNHPAKCTNLYNMHVLPNRECPPQGRLLLFFNQSVGSIACYVTRQVDTLNQSIIITKDAVELQIHSKR